MRSVLQCLPSAASFTVALGGALHGASAQVPRFITLPQREFGETWAYGISGNGRYVVGSDSQTEIENAAVRWDLLTGEQIVLGAIPGTGARYSTAYAASYDGGVVVGMAGRSSTGPRPFRWDAGSGIVSLGDLPGGGTDGAAFAVSGNGQHVGGWSQSAAGAEGFQWTQSSGLSAIGDLPGGIYASVINGASRDGSVLVGESFSSSGGQAIRYTEEGMQTLGDLGLSPSSDAHGVSADGTTIVGWNEGRAFKWTESTGMLELAGLAPNVNNASAIAVSGDGSIVVGTALRPGAGTPEAVIWLPGRPTATRLYEYLRDELGLEIPMSGLRECNSISEDGTVIAGYGRIGQDYRAWAAVIPAPCTLVCLALSLPAVFRRKRAERCVRR